MKNKFFNLLNSLFLLFMVACSTDNSVKSDSKIKLKNQIDSLSYYTGIYIVNDQKKIGIPSINPDAFLRGMNEVIEGRSEMTAKDEANAGIQLLRSRLSEKYLSSNIQRGNTFLTVNKTHKDIKNTISGLQYQVIVEKSQKPHPTFEDGVIINYKGYTIDNKVFQTNTYNNPDTLLLSETIPGFREGLQLMTKGSKYKFYIPTELAYGATPPQGTPIKPMMPVIFEVELIDILKK